MDAAEQRDGEGVPDSQNTGVASLSYYFRNASKEGANQDLIRLTQAGIEALWAGGHDEECRNWFEDALRRQSVPLTIFFTSIAPQMGHGEIGQSSTGRPDSAVGAVTGGGLPLGLAVLFNTAGGFFRDTGKPVSVGHVFQQQLTQINPNSDQARVLIMLHEWAHVVGAQGFLRDGPSAYLPQQASTFNADLLWDRCSGTIGSFSNRRR
jgi:hypothetical protein